MRTEITEKNEYGCYDKYYEVIYNCISFYGIPSEMRMADFTGIYSEKNDIRYGKEIQSHPIKLNTREKTITVDNSFVKRGMR